MRLQSYINEYIDDKIRKDLNIDFIKKNCSQYLKECKKAGKFLYRSSDTKYHKVKPIKPRTDRRPRNTPKELHDYLDILFRAKFGWKARSESVFVASSLSIIMGLGLNDYIFFPIGDFKFIWSPYVDDILATMKDHEIIDPYTDNIIGDIYEWEGIIEDILRHYTDKDLKGAILSGNEVMVKCKEYLMIDIKYNDMLKKELL